MRTTLVTQSTVDEPITIAEVRMHLRNPEITTDDASLLLYIQSAKETVEQKIGRKLMGETWEGYLDSFPVGEIELPFPPLASVTYIKYYDTANVLQTVPTSVYRVDTSGSVGRVTLAFDQHWPGDVAHLENAVIVRFVSGYPSPDAIPASIKHYMQLHAAEGYEQRRLMSEKPVHLSPWAEGLLDKHRVLSV